MLNDTTKYILPLLFNNNDDIIVNETKYGFVNAYLSDINRPQLYNHIFLMYKSNAIALNTLCAVLSKNPNYYSNYSVKINDEYFTVFAFFKPNKYLKDIESTVNGNRFSLPFYTKVIIQKFWNFDADSIEFSTLFQSLNDRDFTYLINNRKTVIKDTIQEEDPPEMTLLERLGITAA